MYYFDRPVIHITAYDYGTDTDDADEYEIPKGRQTVLRADQNKYLINIWETIWPKVDK